MQSRHDRATAPARGIHHAGVVFCASHSFNAKPAGDRVLRYSTLTPAGSPLNEQFHDQPEIRARSASERFRPAKPLVLRPLLVFSCAANHFSCPSRLYLSRSSLIRGEPCDGEGSFLPRLLPFQIAFLNLNPESLRAKGFCCR